MTQRIALITGGAKGIGRAVAFDLAARGWRIAICYRTSEADAKKSLPPVETFFSKRVRFHLVERE